MLVQLNQALLSTTMELSILEVWVVIIIFMRSIRMGPFNGITMFQELFGQHLRLLMMVLSMLVTGMGIFLPSIRMVH